MLHKVTFSAKNIINNLIWWKYWEIGAFFLWKHLVKKSCFATFSFWKTIYSRQIWSIQIHNRLFSAVLQVCLKLVPSHYTVTFELCRLVFQKNTVWNWPNETTTKVIVSLMWCGLSVSSCVLRMELKKRLSISDVCIREIFHFRWQNVM